MSQFGEFQSEGVHSIGRHTLDLGSGAAHSLQYLKEKKVERSIKHLSFLKNIYSKDKRKCYIKIEVTYIKIEVTYIKIEVN